MGTLFLVATPIGNLEDITIRAAKTLASVDIIACEDTRRTSKLAPHKNFVRYDNHTEQRETPVLINELEKGKNIALVSDAGTPLISDPGFLLVREAIKRGIKIVPIPGPSALLTALMVSGLPTHTFTFFGYVPEKKSHRIKLFQDVRQCFKTLKQKPTVIFYCAPHKLEHTLQDLKGSLGDIDIVIARELTKIHEEVWRGKVAEYLKKGEKTKGEIVVLFSI